MADARQQLGSVLGFEGVGPGLLRFQAALRLAGVAADGIPSGNARGGNAVAWRRAAAGETRAADPARPGIAVSRDNETMMLVMVVFAGRARSEAQRPFVLPVCTSTAVGRRVQRRAPVPSGRKEA